MRFVLGLMIGAYLATCLCQWFAYRDRASLMGVFEGCVCTPKEAP